MEKMAEQSEAPDAFSAGWCNLEWTRWFPFRTTSRTGDAAMESAGLYRIRPIGQDIMMYIGWTGESLWKCFNGIRQNTPKLNMPWNDPWPAAPGLWAWRDAKGYDYEFSCVPYSDSPDDLKAAVCYLLYRYRREFRESPLCNFGRFHRKYRRSSDEKDGIVGGKLGAGEPLNPAGGPSASPLTVTGRPGDPGWMGLSWSHKQILKTHTIAGVPPNQGYYLIFDLAKGGILVIGKSEDCGKELFHISRNPPENRELAYSFVCEPKPLPVHNLRERENDLIGNYIEQFGTAPEFQFRDGT